MGALRADRLEQLFVKRAGGGFEFLLVLENAAGARERVTFTAPPTLAATEMEALRRLAAWLAARGARPATKLRVRRESAAGLEEAPELKSALLRALKERRLT